MFGSRCRCGRSRICCPSVALTSATRRYGFWWNRFGPLFAAEIRKRRVHRHCYSNWRWHLDEVFVRINGKTYYLWRAVDHEGEVLEVFATKRRDRRAALRFLKRTIKRYGRPASVVTDGLPSYRAAMNVIGNATAQTRGRWLKQPGRKTHINPFGDGKRAMARFKSERDAAEIYLNPCFGSQPLQSPTPSQPPRYFQTSPGRRLGRVASTRSLRAFDGRSTGPIQLV